jgi:hypothetical protein
VAALSRRSVTGRPVTIHDGCATTVRDVVQQTSIPSGRAFVFPEPGDTVASVAARVLPGEDGGERLLLSWNLHLAVRRSPTGGASGASATLLCTDIVYVEPPRPAT